MAHIEATGTEQRAIDAEVTVKYIAATTPFHREYPQNTVLETVRADAMQFFGVRDYQDRDRHVFYLEFEGRRITDTAETLRALLGEHRRGAEFSLIEEVIQGGVRQVAG